MAIVMQMHWPEVTRSQYDSLRGAVSWEKEVPSGARYHVAWFGKDGFHVTDIWDSEQQFNAFVETRLMPGVQRLGVAGQPRIDFGEVHATFAPNP